MDLPWWFVLTQENIRRTILRKRGVKINHDLGPAFGWIRVDHDVFEFVMAVRKGLGQHRLGDTERSRNIVQLIAPAGGWRPQDDDITRASQPWDQLDPAVAREKGRDVHVRADELHELVGVGPLLGVQVGVIHVVHTTDRPSERASERATDRPTDYSCTSSTPAYTSALGGELMWTPHMHPDHVPGHELTQRRVAAADDRVCDYCDEALKGQA